MLWRPDQTEGQTGILSKRISDKHLKGPYLSFGNVHENGKAGHVVTLTADVAVVPVEQLTPFGGPAARASNPNHQHTRSTNLLETISEQTEQTSVTVGPAHAKEWFQKTQTGLVRSSVSSSVYSKVMGESRTAGRGGASLCTVALTMAVLITGRLGSLGGKGQY